jgi:chromate reductase, NAD(P)H dehydrogenase (quinone)
MSTYQIGLIVGSIRKDSLNKKLAEALIRLAPSDFTFKPIRIDDLPLYNEDEEASPSTSVLRFRGEIRASQGLLFVTPEYNRSIPGVLKNAIDQGSRPKPQSVWALKSAGVLGLSTGALGTSMAQQHLRNVLSALNVYVLPSPEAYIQAKEDLFDEDGNFGAASMAFFKRWMEAYVVWVKKFVG